MSQKNKYPTSEASQGSDAKPGIPLVPFTGSQGLADLERAKQLIPWGTQTNGKRPDESMGEWTPFFVERAEGCRFKDAEGRWFIDYRSALGPIILGYNHTVVQDAVKAQLEKGVLFSLASSVEYEVAEILESLIPGVEQVRFLKSGNEANLASIRLARAHTGRDLIVTCGYHGHGDWFSCGTGHREPWTWPREGNGVPGMLDQLVHNVAYGDLESLTHIFEHRGNEIAALIMVPNDWSGTEGQAFIDRARTLTSNHGTLLIFDQILTGFRLGLKGAQGYYKVIPDLTTYGKAIANGYPLAAFCGRREYMSMLEKVMITTTHAGETLSLAAARATLQILQNEPVFDHISRMGHRLMEGFNNRSQRAGLAAFSKGLPQAPSFVFSKDPAEDDAYRHIFFKELLKQGVFPGRMFLLSYAHKESDIEETLSAMEKGFEALRRDA